MISLLAYGSAVADMPEGQTLGTLSWDFSFGDSSGRMSPGGIVATPVIEPEIEKFTFPLDTSKFSNADQAIAMRITYSGTGDLQLKIRSLPDGAGNPPWLLQKVTTNNYAILGEVKYENVSPGSRLEMWSSFTPLEQGDATAYPSWEDPVNKLEGTHDWREFRLPFDGTGMIKKLARLDVDLHLTGPGTVHFRNMRLVQYPPDGSPPASQALPMQLRAVTAIANPGGIDWKSFLLGVVTTGAFLLAGGGIIFISRRWNRRRHERELRRIASLDS